MSEPKIYLGVYGILLRGSKVLVIKKARGPYIGKYDLPGGGIEFKETIIEALRREILEETGTHLKKQHFLGVNEYQCEYKKNGETKPFHHIGFYYLIDVEGEDQLKSEADGQDSLGSIFLSINDTTEENTSPIAYPMIRKALAADFS